jgi:hypothetical protein
MPQRSTDTLASGHPLCAPTCSICRCADRDALTLSAECVGTYQRDLWRRVHVFEHFVRLSSTAMVAVASSPGPPNSGTIPEHFGQNSPILANDTNKPRWL